MKLSAGRRSGPRQRAWVSVIEIAMTVLLVGMIAGGLVLVVWTLASLRGPHQATPHELAFKGYVSSVLLTGITTIYCGLTGFILLENRRMRVQAVMPHVQVISPLRSGDSISLELQNSGAAPAVDVQIVAWVMKRVGNARTPEPVFYRGHRPALPASQAPTRMQLLLESNPASGEFGIWQEHFSRTAVPDGALDPVIILMAITYRAVNGTEMTDCVALALSEQPTLPGGSTP